MCSKFSVYRRLIASVICKRDMLTRPTVCVLGTASHYTLQWVIVMVFSQAARLHALRDEAVEALSDGLGGGGAAGHVQRLWLRRLGNWWWPTHRPGNRLRSESTALGR